ncbi:MULTISPECIES: hypothetical protein [unclassified Bacillus (in: firmicutes)]|uniref:hypothetical protein n=1 Tax=unclassified Bacillus (in: firmicutes) TaxID=185979 RepID=UPI00178C18E8|nr:MULTISPECIES: hypothetical protein [unclassified Bacillus (in: firmicutes)]
MLPLLKYIMKMFLVKRKFNNKKVGNKYPLLLNTAFHKIYVEVIGKLMEKWYGLFGSCA